MPCEARKQLELEKEKDKRKKKKEEEKKRKEKYDKTIRTLKVQSMRLGWLVKETSRGKFRLTKPNSDDLMLMEVLKDGRINLDTPGTISAVNHKSAEGVLENIAEALKGKWKLISKHFHGATVGHVHTHTH